MHRTTMNTPFFLTYGLDYRTLYFSLNPDYRENFASDLSGRMKIAREVANNLTPSIQCGRVIGRKFSNSKSEPSRNST
jgi:hypothetical protein